MLVLNFITLFPQTFFYRSCMQVNQLLQVVAQQDLQTNSNMLVDPCVHDT